MEFTINHGLLSLSEQLLENVKRGENSNDIEKILASLMQQELIDGLTDDATKKTFWINFYKAWYQLIATRGQ